MIYFFLSLWSISCISLFQDVSASQRCVSRNDCLAFLLVSNLFFFFADPEVDIQQPLVIVDSETLSVSYTGAYYALAHFGRFVKRGYVGKLFAVVFEQIFQNASTGNLFFRLGECVFDGLSGQDGNCHSAGQRFQRSASSENCAQREMPGSFSHSCFNNNDNILSVLL